MNKMEIKHVFQQLKYKFIETFFKRVEENDNAYVVFED